MTIDVTHYVPTASHRTRYAAAGGVLLGAIAVLWAFGMDWRYRVAGTAAAGALGVGFTAYALRQPALPIRHTYLQPDEAVVVYIPKGRLLAALSGGLFIGAAAIVWAFNIDYRIQLATTASALGLGALILWRAGLGKIAIPHAHGTDFGQETLIFQGRHKRAKPDDIPDLLVPKPFLGNGRWEAHPTMAALAVLAADAHEPNLFSCESLGAFSRALGEFVNSEEVGRRAFLVPSYEDWSCNGTQCDPQAHVTVHDQHKIAVLVRKTDRQKTSIIVVSSGPGYWADDHGCDGRVRLAIKAAGLRSDVAVARSLHTVQGRWTGCETFALHHALSWLRVRNAMAGTRWGIRPAGSLEDPTWITRLPDSWCDLEQSSAAAQRLGNGVPVVFRGATRVFNKNLEDRQIQHQRRLVQLLGEHPDQVRAALRSHYIR